MLLYCSWSAWFSLAVSTLRIRASKAFRASALIGNFHSTLLRVNFRLFSNHAITFRIRCQADSGVFHLVKASPANKIVPHRILGAVDQVFEPGFQIEEFLLGKQAALKYRLLNAHAVLLQRARSSTMSKQTKQNNLMSSR